MASADGKPVDGRRSNRRSLSDDDQDASLDELETQLGENRSSGASLRAARSALGTMMSHWLLAAAVALVLALGLASLLLARSGNLPQVQETLLGLGLTASLLALFFCAATVLRFRIGLAQADVALAANEQAIGDAERYLQGRK